MNPRRFKRLTIVAIACVHGYCAPLHAQAPAGPIRVLRQDSGPLETETSEAQPATRELQPRSCRETGEYGREYGFIERRGRRATIVAGGPVPLRSAVNAVNLEYKWAVDFEEPVFHGMPDVCVWNGALTLEAKTFRASYRETRERTVSPADQGKILRRIVRQYNRSTGPGKFVVKAKNGRYSVIGRFVSDDTGRQQKFTPLLDTRVFLPRERRKTSETVLLISEKLLTQGVMSNWNYLDSTWDVENVVGGKMIRARELLAQATRGYARDVSWTLRCNPQRGPDIPTCSLSFSRRGNPAGPLLRDAALTEIVQSERYGISFRYPKSFVLKVNGKDSGESAQNGDDSVAENLRPWRIIVATVEMPRDAYPGTALGDAFFELAVNTVLAEEGCKPQGSEDHPSGQSVIGDVSYRWSPWEGGLLNRGSGFSESEYFTFQNGACYQIKLHWDARFASDADNAPPILPPDTRDIEQRLEAIVYSIRFDSRPPR